LTTNSPTTNSSYAPNPSYPNWIYDMIYEVEVSPSVFGASGFGSVMVPSWHNSPNKLNYDNGLIAYDCFGQTDPQCEPCSGGVNEITIKQLVPGTVTFSNLNANDVVTANPPFYNIKNQLNQRIGASNDIGVHINGTLNTMLHMSCSQPVDPGLVYGDFVITYSSSVSGGPICPPDCNFQEVGFKFEKDKIRWAIKNTGQGNLVLKEVYISWPQGTNGQLEKIKLDGDAYVKLSNSPLSVGEDDWTASNLKPRWIKPGDTRTLEFDFKNNVSTMASNYRITVTFYGTDCVLEYNTLR
jgi:hypothetical protein